MSEFRTSIKIPPQNLRIDHEKIIFCIGSCFTENIHQYLEELHFNSYCNPCGIVYNPISISYQLNRFINNTPWQPSDLLFQNELYHGLHHHGEFSHVSEDQALFKMNQSFNEARQRLEKADVLLITLGTAIVYTYKENNVVVANCHKIPAAHFDRRILSAQEIVEHLTYTLENLRKINNKVKILFTVSPVRYLKEGFSDNTLSKAQLHIAINLLTSAWQDVFYFPAYEIVVDDLRDYRFYDEDMIHPSKKAIEYIWHIFSQTYFSTDTQFLCKRIAKYHRSISHRPLHPDTNAHQLFLQSIQKEKETLLSEFPFLKNL